MSYSDKTGVKGCWSKGALTSNVTRWLPCLLRDLPADNDAALEKCFDAVTKKNSLFGYLFNSPLFLNRDESLYIAHLGFSFLKSCSELARYCFDAKGDGCICYFPSSTVFTTWSSSCMRTQSPVAWACRLWPRHANKTKIAGDGWTGPADVYPHIWQCCGLCRGIWLEPTMCGPKPAWSTPVWCLDCRRLYEKWHVFLRLHSWVGVSTCFHLSYGFQKNVFFFGETLLFAKYEVNG